MPYRRAWIVIAVLIAGTIVAFWHRYFTVLATSPIGFHIHGITSSLWMLLLLAQSRTPHSGQMALHRQLGKASFVALPLFALGSAAVIHSMSVATAAGDPFYALWGAKLGFIDTLAFSAVLYGVGMALHHRRNVRLHAGYMLSTALPLVSPVFGRVIGDTVPGLTVHGPQDFPVFGMGAQLANVLAAVIALWLWRRDPKHGRPWAVAFAVVIVQIIGFELAGPGTAWSGIFLWFGRQPLAALLTAGLLAGIAVIAAGWKLSAPRTRLATARPG